MAVVQADGTIKLDFGSLSRAKEETYDDVLRLASQSSTTASLSLSLSGPVAKLVERVGYWGGKSGIETTHLSLKKGQTARLAFELYASKHTTLGEQQGTLTITVKPAKGASQQSQLPISVDVADPGASPSPSPSCSTTPAVVPKVTSSPSPTPTPAATSSPVATPSASPSASVSPRASASPGVATPSASPAATLVLVLVPIPLAAIGLRARRRRKRSL